MGLHTMSSILARAEDPAAARNDPEAVARIFGTLAHPMRIRALAALCEADLSPVELARLLDEPGMNLGALAYHVRRLADAGVIELSQTIPRRGAIEHRYAITRHGRALARALDSLSSDPDASSPERERP